MTENNLDKFKAYHQLTIDEAMNLILGRELDKWLIFSEIEEKDMPSEAVSIYRALIHDINRFTIPLYDNGIRIRENTFLDYYGSEYYDSLPQGWWIGKTLLTKTLQKWLIDNKIASTFFDCPQINEPDFLNNQLDEYSYKLAAAIKVWQHFYEDPVRILSAL